MTWRNPSCIRGRKLKKTRKASLPRSNEWELYKWENCRCHGCKPILIFASNFGAIYTRYREPVHQFMTKNKMVRDRRKNKQTEGQIALRRPNVTSSQKGRIEIKSTHYTVLTNRCVVQCVVVVSAEASVESHGVWPSPGVPVQEATFPVHDDRRQSVDHSPPCTHRQLSPLCTCSACLTVT